MLRTFAAALLLACLPVLANTAPASEVVIPVVGSIAGANGTFYRTDVTIESFKRSPQRVRFTFLPQAGSGAAPFEKEMTFTAAWSDDVLVALADRSGMGTLIVSGITAEGAADPTAELIVTARIWTQQPDGGEGTFSQTIQAIPLASIDTGRMVIHGMHAAGQYRVNVGVVNLEAEEQDFVIDYNPRLPGPRRRVTVTVPARSMRQVPLPNAAGGAQEVTVSPDGILFLNDPPRRWIAYGSTVDNVTGDGWTVVGFSRPGGPFIVFPPEE